jgi:choice-of-anchor B domain-containing protein
MKRVVSGLAVAGFLSLATVFSPIPAKAVNCDTIPPRPPIQFDSVHVFQYNGGASCWGWTAPDGTPYAIMGAGDGVGFVDVATMTQVGFVSAQPCSWRELKTYRHYCYVVSECTGDKQGMMIIDLQYLPDSVHYIGSYSNLPNVRSHCISIDTARAYCYLVRQNYTGFRIVNLSNPEAPFDEGSVTTGYLHDMTAFNDTVYAAEGYNSAFSIWDCTNKASPVQLAHVTIPGNGFVHNLWPTSDRRFLASTEELPDFRTMKFWNIENLTNIFKVGEYLGPGGIPHNAHIEGKYIYLSHYSSGVSVLDISTPECLQEAKRFDTYTASDNPDFVGCWGVFPHTNNTGYVYASNIDGRLFIFHTNIVNADFAGTPHLGSAPLSVDFKDTSPGHPTAWNWDFGDGSSSTLQNPSHVFNAGIWNVSMTATLPSGNGSMSRPAFITALAETLMVADTSLPPNAALYWDIRYDNHLPIYAFNLPIDLSNSPEIAIFDSISTVGCRTAYFEQQVLSYDDRPDGQAAIKLMANNGGGSPPLAPGSGPIARVYFHILPGAVLGQQVVMTMPTVGSGHSLNAAAATTTFVPNLELGTLTVVQGCSCTCRADPVCDGSVDVLDVTSTINVAFRGTAATVDPACNQAARTDVDCNGSTDILDVVTMINVAFRGLNAGTAFCNPCTR